MDLRTRAKLVRAVKLAHSDARTAIYARSRLSKKTWTTPKECLCCGHTFKCSNQGYSKVNFCDVCQPYNWRVGTKLAALRSCGVPSDALYAAVLGYAAKIKMSRKQDPAILADARRCVL